MSYKNMMAFSAVLLMAAGPAMARDQIRIVGSSTVFPFSSYVAEEMGQTTKHPTPVVESTGSGGGMKLFCEGDGMNTPDITNASRRMKESEFRRCQENGVNQITEAVIGYDGIALAQNKKAGALNLSRQDVLLAVAKEVPAGDGSKLIANPYKFWDEIDSRLPHRKILFYGPPTTSGTRDAFEDLAMKHLTKKMNVYRKVTKKYHEIRQDGVYVPSGENDNLIVQKLVKDKNAIGIFGYSFLEENSDRLAGASIGGVQPDPETVASGQYPYSRSLYFYIKNSHDGKVPSMNKYTEMFMSEEMIGEDGQLTEIGLIPLPVKMREKARNHVARRVKLTLADFKKK